MHNCRQDLEHWLSARVLQHSAFSVFQVVGLRRHVEKQAFRDTGPALLPVYQLPQITPQSSSPHLCLMYKAETWLIPSSFQGGLVRRRDELECHIRVKSWTRSPGLTTGEQTLVTTCSTTLSMCRRNSPTPIPYGTP